jgi:hypothetical protein
MRYGMNLLLWIDTLDAAARPLYQSEHQLAADGLRFMKDEVAKRWR